MQITRAAFLQSCELFANLFFFYQTGEASHNSGEIIYLGVMQSRVVGNNQEGPQTLILCHYKSKIQVINPKVSLIEMCIWCMNIEQNDNNS